MRDGAVRLDDHVQEVDRIRRGDVGWPASSLGSREHPRWRDRRIPLLLAVPRGTERPRITPPPPHSDANIEHLEYDLREVWERLALVSIQPRSAR